eukprot:SAG22_NODE_93_length_20834_cov_27.179503_5_plen_148_part_00
MDATNDRCVQAASAQISKHHGIYQQCLRDYDQITEEEKRNPFSFMVRVRLPGGDCTAAQMRQMVDICNMLSNGTIKITTRQTFQLHGILKNNLIEAIHQMNRFAVRHKTLSFCCASTAILSKTVPFHAVRLASRWTPSRPAATSTAT